MAQGKQLFVLPGNCLLMQVLEERMNKRNTTVAKTSDAKATEVRNPQLTEMTRRWEELERKTDEQRKAADKFYDDNLMKLIEQDFIRRNRGRVLENVDDLVISVGTSYEPIVLSISIFHPKQILFLYTERSEQTLNKIIHYCALEADLYEKRRVNEIDPIDIYREIKDAYLRWGRPLRMYIDFTGGTKTMSAAAALAGAMIDVQMVYVGSDDYLVDFRKPNPGSEQLVYIDNPLSVFGDLEIEKAFELFSRNNFSGTIEKLEQIKDRIPDPDIRQELNFVWLLAHAYESWDALDFVPAWDYMNQLYKEIRRDQRIHPDFLLMDKAQQMSDQLEVLEKLHEIPAQIREKKQINVLKNDEQIQALMFTMLQNALTREEQQKYDMATLLLYRLLEMIEQSSLARYGLYVSRMEYRNTVFDEERCPEVKDLGPNERLTWLKDEVNRLRSALFRTSNNQNLPNPVSLLDGYMILTALRDPVTEGIGGKPVSFLQKIRSKVFLRNNSIFAHGLGPVSTADYEKFRDFVLEVFRHYCDIHSINFLVRVKIMDWIDPMKSANYARNMEVR